MSAHSRALDSAFVCSTLGLPPSKPVAFARVSIDSRDIASQDLFVALPGENFDGHAFIAASIEKGATGIVCERIPENLSAELRARAEFFVVPSSLGAFRSLAHAWRKTFDVPVIAVAGSVGKTTTKELLATVLRKKWERVASTQGSQNGFLGIPLTLFQLRADTSAIIVEIGIDEIGAMIEHAGVVEPTHTLLTAIGPEHLEKLIDVPTVLREEWIIATETAKIGGKNFIQLEDPLLAQNYDALTDRSAYVAVGWNGRGRHRARELANHSIEVEIDGVSETIQSPIPGAHNVRNLLLVIETALDFGLKISEIREALLQFKPAFGRTDIQRLGSHLVYCDYYNANPTSMVASLHSFAGLRTSERQWIVIADMKELGTDEERFHRELADAILPLSLAGVVLHGPRMSWLKDELEKKHYSGKLAHFDDRGEAARFLSRELQSGDSILIKGSRSMKMEEVFEHLKNGVK